MASAISDIQPSEIVNYYKNKGIFITGATGFLGKVLIEKLLRSCYDLKKIYILVRPKKGINPNERLNEIFDSRVSKKSTELKSLF
jgi:fatty acyl-CoA reductase